MIPAKGWQQYMNAGINLKWKQFELQIAPELQQADNIVFAKYPINSTDWEQYYYYLTFYYLYSVKMMMIMVM